MSTDAGAEEPPSPPPPPPPPQPPVRSADAQPPPIVDGIGSADGLGAGLAAAAAAAGTGQPEGETEEGEDGMLEVPPADLASFGELIARFEARIDKAATGRKYKELRAAWDRAVEEIGRESGRVDLAKVGGRVVEALRAGCESAKVAVVDACLDCTHRLFEYGHLGGGGEATEIVLDDGMGVLDEVVGVVCGCLEVKEEEVYLRMVQTLLTAATSTKSGLHHGTLLAAVRTIYNIYLNAKMQGTRTTARVSLVQILNLVFARMEAETEQDSTRLMVEDGGAALNGGSPAAGTSYPGGAARGHVPLGREQSTDSTNGGGGGAGGPGPAEDTSDFSSILQKDAYLLFRALCKLSAKDLLDDSGPESVGLRSKLLSLELLRGLVSASGPAFRSGERFIYALRHYLAPSLLTNCMSSSMEVVDISLDIFDMLLRKETLRPLLKTEIGAFFDTVLFRFLESSSAGLPRRRRALIVLNRLATDRQTLADLFLNYDCDMESPKIFERIVSVLASVAENPAAIVGAPKSQGATGAEAGLTVAQEEDLRMSALGSIVQVVASLRDWSRPIEDAKGQNLAALAQNLSGDDLPYNQRAATNGGDKVNGGRADGVVGEGSEDGGGATERYGQGRLGLQLSRSTGSGVSDGSVGEDALNGRNGAVAEERDGDGHAVPLAGSGSVGSLAGGIGGGVLGTVSEGSDRDTSRFEEALKAKRATEEGVALFNKKPRKGVDLLISSNRLEKNASAVAKFLLTTEKLDATMVGEYIGDGDSFCISVMHAYTDMKAMEDMTFDDALRMYLAGFRLPGEAQKIDRIMEKFSSRYCECNPGIFANAETAFILSYSTIMLHTDAHNPMVRKKMTKEEFVRNNRGINDGGDLPLDFLSGLYDRITTTEFRLSANMRDSAHEAATAALADTAVSAAVVDPSERARKFKEESDRLMAQSRVLFASRRKTTEDYIYFSASNVYHARLMFSAAWHAVLVAISLLLEKATPSDTNTVALCLEGFRNSIAISSTFGMGTTKDAFVSSLAKFTHLNSVTEMRAKNVECVRMILAIAALEGSNLGDQWVLIVRAISQVEQIRAVAAGNPGKFVLPKMPLGSVSSPFARSVNMGFPADAGSVGAEDGVAKTDVVNGSNSSTTSSTAVSGGNSVASGIKGVIGNGTASLLAGATSGSMFGSRRSSATMNGETASTSSGTTSSKQGSSGEPSVIRIDSKAATVAALIDESEIERIFINSSQLSAAGVADFCAALCTVALEELSESNGPRLFCMQKIVEMAYYNMESRTRMQWGKIWEQMGPFFASAMCHSNRDVSMYSIDALRQLASKFLEKDELSNFSFQRSFLKPFEECFARSKSVPVRELVLTCVSQIVLARAANIKSGWKSVFAMLALAADDKNESIMNFGFQVVESIVRKYFGEIDDVFVDAVTGISAYCRSPLSSSVSLSAIDLLTEKCAVALVDGRAFAAARPVDKNGIPVASCAAPVGKDSIAVDDPSVSRELEFLRGNSADGTWFTADVEAHIGAWFPILTGLAGAIQDERPNVREAASKGLYKVLSDSGGRFAPSLWVLIFRGVLSPMFDDVRHLSNSEDRAEASAVSEWASSAGAQSLRSTVDVIVQHLEVTRILLPDLLDLMRSWIVQETESVAREGMNVMSRLVKTAGDMMISEDWQLVVDTIRLLFGETMPREVLGPDASSLAQNGGAESENKVTASSPVKTNGESNGSGTAMESESSDPSEPTGQHNVIDGEEGQLADSPSKRKKIDFRALRAKCVVQLLLIQLVQDAVVSFYLDLSTPHVLLLASSVEQSYVFAHDFNANTELRFSLWRSGFMNQVPNLLKQETTGLTTYLRIIFWLYLDEAKESEVMTEPKLIELCDRVLRGFVQSCEDARAKPEEQREVSALIPVVVFILNGMMQMSNEQFDKHLPSMYHLLLSLMECADDRLVRSAVSNLFRARIGPKLEFPAEEDEEVSEFVPNPQVPGRVRERVFAVEGIVGERAVATEAQSVLAKVSGVRSCFVNAEDGVARVFTSAPDELLVAALAGVGDVSSVRPASGTLV